MGRTYLLLAVVSALGACGNHPASSSVQDTSPFAAATYQRDLRATGAAGDSPSCDGNADVIGCCPDTENLQQTVSHADANIAITSIRRRGAFAATRQGNTLLWTEVWDMSAADPRPCNVDSSYAYTWDANGSLGLLVDGKTIEGCPTPASQRCTYTGTVTRQRG